MKGLNSLKILAIFVEVGWREAYQRIGGVFALELVVTADESGGSDMNSRGQEL